MNGDMKQCVRVMGILRTAGGRVPEYFLRGIPDAALVIRLNDLGEMEDAGEQR